MLKNDFYTITGKETDPANADSVVFKIRLNPDHPIFIGHFPDNPIVPGVCQVQIVRELAGEYSGLEYAIGGADNIKYMAMIIPSQHPNLVVQIDFKRKPDQELKIDATISSSDIVFLKLKGMILKS